LSLNNFAADPFTIVDNYKLAGNVSSTEITVPTGKKWMLYGGFIERDANASLKVTIKNSGGNTLFESDLLAADTTNITYGVFGDSSIPISHPIPMDAGSIIAISWGALQTNPRVCAVVKEF